MAGESTLKGKLAAKTVSGVLNGKTILASYRLTGTEPSPGEHTISGMDRDPDYGDHIWMTPVRRPGFRVVGVHIKTDAVYTGTAVFGDVWILCAKPIPGNNCLVFTRGFSDLVAALGRFGDAKMTWS
jgi:hypothetical protein